METKSPSTFYTRSAIKAAVRKAGFERLSPAEASLFELATTGDTLEANSEATAEIGQVADGANWPAEREIRADLIVWLCIGSMKDLIDPKGIFIAGAKITGSLNLFNANVTFAVRFSQCYFAQVIILDYARIASFDLGRSQIPGLSGFEVTANRSLRLNNGFVSSGGINLWGANISGDVDFTGATISNPGAIALMLTQAIIGGSLRLQMSNEKDKTPFRAIGEVELTDGQISGDFNCTGGVFDNGDKNALTADGATVKGDVFLSSGFRSIGTVSLIQIQVGQSLGFQGSSFSNPGGVAIDANSCNVKMNVTFGRSGGGGTKIDGKVYLNDAQITQTIYLVDVDLRQVGLNLAGANAAYLADTSATNWPNVLNLKGFQYGAVVEGPKNAEARFMWLQRQEDFNSESYVQAAKVLLLSGDEEGAHYILEKLERIKAHRRPFPFYANPANWFQESIGYGYQPIRAIWISGLLSFLGWIVYRRSYLAGSIVPTDKDANADFVEGRTLPPQYVRFSPLIFSIETSLPLVKLGQGDKWQPTPDPVKPSVPAATSGVTTATGVQKKNAKTSSRLQFFDPIRNRLAKAAHEFGLIEDSGGLSVDRPWSRIGTSSRFVKWFIWIQILLGWALATLFVAGYGGLVHK